MQSGKCMEVILGNESSPSTRLSLKWAVMRRRITVTVEAIRLLAVEVVTDLWDRTSASSVAAQDTGLVTALQQAVVVVEVAAGSLPAPGLVAAGETAMLTVNVMWMIDTMEGVLGIETAMIVEIASMLEAAVAIQVIGNLSLS